MAENFNLSILEENMKKSIENLESEFTGLKTGRANPALLAHIMVSSYGQMIPLTQLANISASDARMLLVQVWDKSAVPAVEKAIRTSGLGLNPIVDGQLIRLPISPLTQEGREELAKLAGKYTEQACIALRSIRHNTINDIKKIEKTLSKDEVKIIFDKIQTITDKYIDMAKTLLRRKEKEILI